MPIIGELLPNWPAGLGQLRQLRSLVILHYVSLQTTPPAASACLLSSNGGGSNGEYLTDNSHHDPAQGSHIQLSMDWWSSRDMLFNYQTAWGGWLYTRRCRLRYVFLQPLLGQDLNGLGWLYRTG